MGIRESDIGCGAGTGAQSSPASSDRNPQARRLRGRDAPSGQGRQGHFGRGAHSGDCQPQPRSTIRRVSRYEGSAEEFGDFLTWQRVASRLFLDPFLLLKAGATWAKAHDHLVDHFAHCYNLVVKAHGQKSLSAKAAHRLLTFPEPYEFGLGYTAASTHGSGGGVK